MSEGKQSEKIQHYCLLRKKGKNTNDRGTKTKPIRQYSGIGVSLKSQ